MSDITSLPSTGRYDLKIHRGASYSQTFQVRESDGVTVFNLAGFDAFAKVKSRGSELLSFNVTLDVDAGEVTIDADTEATGALKIAPDAQWDLLLDDGAGSGFFLVEGSVELDPQVTTSE